MLEPSRALGCRLAELLYDFWRRAAKFTWAQAQEHLCLMHVVFRCGVSELQQLRKKEE